MRFKIPGRKLNVRLFERVETTDSQYDIFDVGLEQADGSLDSMVVGGSFSYARSLSVASCWSWIFASHRRDLLAPDR